MVLLTVVVVLSAAHLGWLIVEEILRPPRFLIAVQGLLDIFGYFLLVLIRVELLETLKMYLKRDIINMRVVLEVALIAMARKVITEEPESVSALTLFGIAALILVLAIAFYFERQARDSETDVQSCRSGSTSFRASTPGRTTRRNGWISEPIIFAVGRPEGAVRARVQRGAEFSTLG